MASKRQFLDPISGGCRFILLKLLEAKTKIRISDHTIKLVPYSITERYFYRPWKGDSREDMCALYPMIIRFIELYLNEKKPKQSPVPSEDDVHKKSKPVKQHTSLIDDPFEDDVKVSTDIVKKTDADYSVECYEYLKLIAQYMIEGLHVLEKTYEYDNSVFTLQYFANLLKAGIDGTYSSDLLPPHLKDFTSQNLFDVDKIKNLWKNQNIIQLGDLFQKCFDAKTRDASDLVNAYKVAIESILEARDEEFQKLVSQTENA